MLKIATILLFCLSSMIITAQKIWKGDLKTENLQAFFEGKFDEVDGSILITKYNQENLDLLKALKKSKGSIRIFNNEKLRSLDGLELLKHVGGIFYIYDNPNLYNFCALNDNLINNGIKGIEISKGIFEKWDVDNNEYDPSLMNLQNDRCSFSDPLKNWCFSC